MSGDLEVAVIWKSRSRARPDGCGDGMNSAEARRRIGEALEGLLKIDGFVYRARQEGLVKAIPGGRQLLFMGFWSYSPLFVFSLVPAVRIDAIAELWAKITNLSDRYRPETVSLTAQLWKLAGMEKPIHDVPVPSFGCPFYYNFSSEEEFSRALEAVTPVVHDLVQPFFAQYRDVASVNRAINHDGLDTSNGRIFQGLIAARLARDPEYEGIAARYRQEMEAWSANDRQLFEKALEYLAAYPVR